MGSPGARRAEAHELVRRGLSSPCATLPSSVSKDPAALEAERALEEVDGALGVVVGVRTG